MTSKEHRRKVLLGIYKNSAIRKLKEELEKQKDRYSKRFMSAVWQKLDPTLDFDMSHKGDKYIAEILGWEKYARKNNPSPILEKGKGE